MRWSWLKFGKVEKNVAMWKERNRENVWRKYDENQARSVINIQLYIWLDANSDVCVCVLCMHFVYIPLVVAFGWNKRERKIYETQKGMMWEERVKKVHLMTILVRKCNGCLWIRSHLPSFKRYAHFPLAALNIQKYRVRYTEWLLHAWEYHFVWIFCSCCCWFYSASFFSIDTICLMLCAS